MHSDSKHALIVRETRAGKMETVPWCIMRQSAHANAREQTKPVQKRGKTFSARLVLDLCIYGLMGLFVILSGF